MFFEVISAAQKSEEKHTHIRAADKRANKNKKILHRIFA